MPARAIGINHGALEVGDVREAEQFYRSVFGMPVRGHAPGMAFLDMGDQFLALSEHGASSPDEHRHFGIVVDDGEAVRAALAETNAELLPGRGLDFRDPWGNHVQVVQYSDVQFTKSPSVLSGMGADGLEKSESARAELAKKGIL
jgi:catechol-2,3-dioxygenase